MQRQTDRAGETRPFREPKEQRMSMKRGPRRDREPKLLGAYEAAERLGIGQTNLRTIRGLPDPYDKIRAATLWRATEIDELARRRNTRRNTKPSP